MFRILCASLLVIVLFSSCGHKPTTGPAPSPTPEQPPIALFLLDATSSLNEDEHKQVAKLATDMLRVLPPGSRYGVYPIHIEADRVPAIIPDTNISAQQTDVDRNDKLPTLEKVLTDKLYKVYKTGDRIADDRRSCIMNMLWFAEDQLKRLSGTSTLEANNVYRLVIISDMVEECGSSPLGEVRLNKQNIAEEIKLADNSFTQITSQPNLSTVRVTVIFPLAEQTPMELSRRPADRDLRLFWKKILTHCQVKDENFEWISTGQLPNWSRRLAEQRKATDQL